MIENALALLDFLATVVLVSVSGVLGPGPLFLASTLRATKLGALSGIQCAIGHAIVELPLVFGLALGVATLLNPTSLKVIGILGGSVLLVFAALQFFRVSRGIDSTSTRLPDLWERRPGVVLGVIFTALNPFFILWWLTVGSALISRAIIIGAWSGVGLMLAAHIWMDYAWLGGTATIAGRGKQLLFGKWYKILLTVFGVAMAYFGAVFILQAIA